MTALRCKPGDLAVVVKTDTPELLGRLVVVESRAHVDGTGSSYLDGNWFRQLDQAAWICSAAGGGMLPARTFDDEELFGLPRRVIEDSRLRPIRPNDGEDESLSWARPRTDELALSDGGAHAA